MKIRSILKKIIKISFHKLMIKWHMRHFDSSIVACMENVLDNERNPDFFLSYLKKYLQNSPNLPIDESVYCTATLYDLDDSTVDSIVYHMKKIL